jgi:hypothetical protein
MTDNYTTTNAGAPAPSDELSLSLGPDGPILLQDSYLIEPDGCVQSGAGARALAACQRGWCIRPLRSDQ